jgi:hypothetical protein
MSKLLVPLLLIASFASGCAQAWPTPKNPQLGMEATGEQLWVRTQAHQATYATKEKVGEVVHKDSTGQNVGTSEVYEDKLTTVHWTTWYPMQGDSQLDDEDFLRIVGNEQALDEHRDYREKGMALNKWGKGMMVGGFVGFLASYFVPADNYTLRYGLSTGGLLVGSSGWYVARMGAARFEPEAHTIDPSHANYNIQRYNRSLAGGDSDKPQASLSIGKKF